MVITSSLIDKLCKLNNVAPTNNIIRHSIDTKYSLTNENSLILWHLSHISKQCIKKLISHEIINSLHTSDFDVCSECVKGKINNKRNKGVIQCNDVLELTHINICKSFPKALWND